MRLAAIAAALLLAGCATPATPPPTGTGVEGRAMVGPTCPVERTPPDPQCADRPFLGNLTLAAPDGTATRTFTTNATGGFRVDAAPGDYAIQNAAGEAMLPRCSTPTFTVVAGAYTHVEVACDSGIR